MKYKLLIFCLILTLLVGGCIVENRFIRRSFDEFDLRIEQTWQDGTFYPDQILQTEQWWHTRKSYLSLTVSVVLLNDISVTLAEYTGAVQADDTATATEMYRRLLAYSSSLREMHSARGINIL